MHATSIIALALLAGVVISCGGGHPWDALALLFLAYAVVSAARKQR